MAELEDLLRDRIQELMAERDAALEDRERLRAEVRKVFVWKEERQVIEERDYDGDSDLSPEAWPAIRAALEGRDD